MRQYPLTQADGISKEVANMINHAFYDGFIVGLCDDKETFDGITPEEYKYAAVTAIQALAKFQGRPDPIEELLKEATV